MYFDTSNIVSISEVTQTLRGIITRFRCKHSIMIPIFFIIQIHVPGTDQFY